MNFERTPEQNAIVDAVTQLCADFGPEYWSELDGAHRFPEAFHQAMAGAGWLGIAMPERFGGAGLGITEAALIMQTVSASGAGFSGASAIHMNVFGLNPVVVFGTEAQQQAALPPLIEGRDKACFAVTEPDAGLDTTHLKTQAVRTADGSAYRVDGRKIWISTAQVATRMLLLARTTPLDAVAKPTQGLSLFYTALDRNHIEVREIDKMGRGAVDSNMLFIDGLMVPAADRIGEEGRGFEYILHGLNPERILIAAEAVGLGRAALNAATRYARERTVFGRPIGQNQGVQFPIARAYAQTHAARLTIVDAAARYDAGQACGEQANIGKMLASEASWAAADMCLQTHGGFGFAEEYDIERKFRETRLYQVAPISTNLILAYVAEHVLGLPRSY